MLRLFLSVALLLPALSLHAVAETDDHAARLRRWRDAQLGMFIHWGLYSAAAGRWNGQAVPGYSSWIMDKADIPLDEYVALLERFDASRFDADAVVALAKAAGMKYLVVTAKHHEGFCLFPSEHTQFDVMSTPARRDLIGELAAACERAGLMFGVYYSILDWHHPDYLPRRTGDRRPTDQARFDRYVAYMKAQLAELLDNYPTIEILWFDGEWDDTWTHERAKDLWAFLRERRPGLLINNRIDKGRRDMAGMNHDFLVRANARMAKEAFQGGTARLTDVKKYLGDFGTPEQVVPTGHPDTWMPNWESCITTNKTWGYKRDDTQWKSVDDLVHIARMCRQKGGNLLLNIGPRADGTVPTVCADRLRALGTQLEPSQAWTHPLKKLGKLDSPLVEITPFVFDDRLYLYETWKEFWELPTPPGGPPLRTGDVVGRIRDMARDEVVSVALGDNRFGIAYTWKDQVYVFGCSAYKSIRMTRSDDLKTWTEPVVVLEANEDEKLFNVAVCRGEDRFIMLVETNDPRWPYFTFKFYESDNLVNWRQIPGAYYGLDKYVGGPALYRYDGWYYMLYLEDLPGRHWETRIARSRNLIHWEDAPEGRPFVTFDPENLVHPIRSRKIHECNASDAELVYCDSSHQDPSLRGKTLVFFTGGDQIYAGDLQWAEYDGKPNQLLRSFFD